MGGNQSVLILKILALMIGLSLWGLSMWFFLVAVGSLWKYCKPTKNMPFQMTFFSFVFPNTALVSWYCRSQLTLPYFNLPTPPGTQP